MAPRRRAVLTIPMAVNYHGFYNKVDEKYRRVLYFTYRLNV